MATDTLSRRQAAGLAAILLLALLLRVVPLSFSHFWDEAVFMQHALVMLDGRTNYDEFYHRPPLLSVLYAGAFALWQDIYAAQMVQGLATTLGVLFGFLYARRAFGVRVALGCALFLAFTPYLVFISWQLLTDMPAVTLLLGAMWLFDRTGARWALAAGVMVGLAILTRYTSGFVLLYFGLLLVAGLSSWLRLLLLGIGAGVAVAPYLVWSKLTFGGFLHPMEHARNIVTLWTAPVPGRLYWEGLFQVFPISVWVLLLLALALLVRRIAASARGRRAAQAAPPAVDGSSRLLAALLAWGAAYFAYMLSVPHKEVRYLAPLAIPVCVAAAVGLDALLARLERGGKGVKGAALAVTALVAVLEFAPGFRKLGYPWVENWEWPTVQVAGWLARHSAPGDVIYAVHDFPVLAFYSGRKTVPLLPIQDQFAARWRAVMDRPGYFVHFRPEGVKESHGIYRVLLPGRAFLDNTPGFAPVADFGFAIVYRYRPGG